VRQSHRRRGQSQQCERCDHHQHVVAPFLQGATKVHFEFVHEILCGDSDSRWSPSRVRVHPIRDCARGCNNCGHTHLKIKALYVTEKILSVCIWFQEWAHLGPESTVPMHPQLRLFIVQLFLDFCAFFSSNGPSLFKSSRFTK